MPKPPTPPRHLSPQEELEVLIRARYPVIYVVSWEEERVERCLREIAEKREKNLFVWTVTQGIVKSGVEPQQTKMGGGNTADPLAALDAVIQQVQPAIYLFKDFHRFTVDDRCNLTVIRRLRDVAYHLRDTYKSLVIVAPSLKISQELAKDVTVVEFGLPRIEDFDQLLDRIIDDVKDNPQVQIDLNADARERLLHAAGGLTLKEAENVFAKTLGAQRQARRQRRERDLQREAADHQEERLAGVLRGDRRLQPGGGPGQPQAVAGQAAHRLYRPCRPLRALAAARRDAAWACRAAARAFARRPWPACGTCRLLRFDVGQMFSSLVGSSEENVRRAIQTAESVAPVILWIDEIDKALAGSAASAGSDGGTSARVFGTILTWLSEKTSPVFVICTANEIAHLPPELLRKGRLDEIFFVDLPSDNERVEILRIHLKKRSRDPGKFDLAALARASDGFSGAEIEEAIISALFDAFSGQVELSTELIQKNLAETVPLVEDHERRDEPAAELGQRPGTAGINQTSAGQRRRCPQDRVLAVVDWKTPCHHNKQ